MRVVVFGTGAYYRNRKEYFRNVEIVAFMDNNSKIQNTILDGVPVYAPKDAVLLEYDYICIMSDRNTASMIKQLIELNADIDKMIIFETFVKKQKRIISEGCMQTYYKNVPGDVKGKKGKILLMTHELSLSGAPIVLFYAAQILKKNGYDTAILSPKDGGLREVIMKSGIPVFVDAGITGDNEYLKNWMMEFDLVIVCTLTYGQFVGEMADFPRPIIWWLHESEEVYSGWWPRAKPERIGSNVSIYAVGHRAIATYKKYFKNDNCKNLIYGIPNINDNWQKGYVKNHDNIVFAVIGVLQPRKGQDIFIEAIRRMRPEDKANAEFWLIGPDPGIYPEFTEKLRQAAEKEPSIKIMGEMSMEMIKEQYPNIDVVVSPSRDDPMPVVMPEAMMFYKTCIVSDGAGTSALIEHKKNGLVCTCDADSLAEQMTWVMHNQDKLMSIGVEGRKLYENVFSTEAFEKNLVEIVEGKLCSKTIM